MEKWQWGIVIDAGSSGSRLHVYKWHSHEYAKKHADKYQFESLPEVKLQETKKIKPGISTFGNAPSAVGPDHLQELLDFALKKIPGDQVRDTPIFLLATAGVRLLPDLQRNALLKEVCDYTRANTDFALPDCDLHIQSIHGKTEGLYGWIATNYLLGSFDSPSSHYHGKQHHTYGFLDMGGASAQIAFAPNSTEAETHAKDLKLLRLRKTNGAVDEYRIYVKTWLGFGVHEAKKHYLEALLYETNEDGELPDPCLPKGLRTDINGEILGNTEDAKRWLVGTGKFNECLRKSKPLLKKGCSDLPCLIDGVDAPAIDYDVNHFVGISEYWHTTHEIFEMGHKDKAYDYETYQKRVIAFCESDWDDVREGIKDRKWGKKVDENVAKDICFKANWIINVLHEGIGIPRIPIDDHHLSNHNVTEKVLKNAKDRGFTDSFQAVHKIDDTEVSWTLGKMVLYASSEIPPNNRSNFLPVGFGSNTIGIPDDFQYPGKHAHSNTSINATQPLTDSWRDSLFEGKTPRRIPGFLLFLLIICIAMFLLCGKERRSRFYNKIISRFGGPGGRLGRRKGGFFTPKISLHGANERLLEGGIRNPEDFELGDMDSDEEYSDDSTGGKTGKTSGWATPRLRASHVDGASEDYVSIGSNNTAGFGLGINAMERSGLFPRTESRESLYGVERGRRSRRASPTRHKSPLMSLVED